MQSVSTLSSALFSFSMLAYLHEIRESNSLKYFQNVEHRNVNAFQIKTQKERSEKLIKKLKNLRKNSSSGNEANLEKIAGREYCALTGAREYNENDHLLKYEI